MLGYSLIYYDKIYLNLFPILSFKTTECKKKEHLYKKERDS